MLTGVKLKASPSKKQKMILSQWMGCARVIWNAKCEENHYLTRFSKRYLPLGNYPPIDQKYSQYKTELTPWLTECPSQILRNTASNWYTTYRSYQKGLCGKPVRKKKSDAGSIHLTKELFCFERCADGVTRLFIGTKTNHIGYLPIKNHCSYKPPNSLRITRKNGIYYVSFCYEDSLDEETLFTQTQHLEYLQKLSNEELEKITIGVDRGVKRPVQAGNVEFDFTPEQKKKKLAKEKYIKRVQKRLSSKQKGSKRWKKTKGKLSRAHEKIGNIRKDFCHKTSRAIVDQKEVKVIVLEDLRTKQMTRKPKAKQDPATKKWLKNHRASKAGLNRSILDKGWCQLENYLKYKTHRAGKALFKVSPQHTSQECADCGHTHPDNRKTQELFHCVCCGHSDNADHNAAKVIKKRAIKLIMDSGTELSSKGVLLDKGRGAAHKTRGANANRARSRETSKKKELVTEVA
jgi:putative transposase